MKRCVLAVLMVFALALPAMGAVDYNICFSRIDADYDGEASRAEFDAAFPGGDPAVFRAADADNSGPVSHEEWEDYKQGQGFEEGEHHDG